MAIIDTNVLIHGRGNFDFDSTVLLPEVIEEAKSNEGKNVVRNLDYRISEPSEDSIKKVEKISNRINSPTSEVDEKLAALSVDQDDVLVTDDKALQNLALHLKVEFEGFLDEEIEEKFEWEKVCSNCNRQISTLPCPHCGSQRLRRRQVRCS